MYHRIRALREDNDYSQTIIAKVIKTTQQQYSKIENGIADISGEKMILLAEFYHVSTDYILGLTDQKTAYANSTESQNNGEPQ